MIYMGDILARYMQHLVHISWFPQPWQKFTWDLKFAILQSLSFFFVIKFESKKQFCKYVKNCQKIRKMKDLTQFFLIFEQFLTNLRNCFLLSNLISDSYHTQKILDTPHFFQIKIIMGNRSAADPTHNPLGNFPLSLLSLFSPSLSFIAMCFLDGGFIWLKMKVQIFFLGQ